MLRLGIIAAALAALAIAIRLLVLLANGPGTPGGPATVDGGIQHGTGDPRCLMPVLQDRGVQWLGRAALHQLVPAAVGIHGVEATGLRDMATAVLGGNPGEGQVGAQVEGIADL